jgi:hypothetical protein
MVDKKHKINESLHSRLHNYKFESAKQYLEGEPDEIKLLVNSLADMFGDVGWGLGGHISILVAFALSEIGVEGF